ncbi:MAG: GFA family protein [Pseudoxanthomonas sp.]|nr:GFA family protein [Pseudoxanthomonas sp.]
MSLDGRCLCGLVQYRVDGTPQVILNCHCDFCRRMSGAPLSTYVVVLDKELAVTQGAEELRSHSATSNATRHFCATCSTPLFNRNVLYPGLAMLYLGSLDDGAALAPALDIHRESRLPWIDSVSELVHYEREYVRTP